MPGPEEATDDYYHYYMASQKRVSRWISQTQRELETATPMPVPSLFDVSMGPSAIKESLGERRRGKEGKESKKEKRAVGEDAERGLRSNSTSTLVASSSSKTRGGEEESPESRRKRKEKERLSGEKDKERRRHHHYDDSERSKRPKDKMDAIIEEDGPRRERERYGKKRTSSMSPPPSTFKPRTKGNALALNLFGQEDSTVVTETVSPTDHLGSAEDLARHRAKERREEKGKERERVREKEKERDGDREREKRKPSVTSSSPPKSSRSRGRSDKLAALDVLERRELDRQRAGYRSRSRATSKRSSKPHSSSSGFDLSSTSFQALLVLLSSSMLMIAVAPKVGAFMSVSVAAAMVIVANMVSECR